MIGADDAKLRVRPFDSLLPSHSSLPVHFIAYFMVIWEGNPLIMELHNQVYSEGAWI